MILAVLHDSTPFAQFKNMKNSHGGVLFFRFLNCKNGTK